MQVFYETPLRLRLNLAAGIASGRRPVVKLSLPSDKFGALFLPACLLYAGDFTLVSKLSEADSADSEFTEISVGTSTDLASVVLTG